MDEMSIERTMELQMLIFIQKQRDRHLWMALKICFWVSCVYKTGGTFPHIHTKAEQQLREAGVSTDQGWVPPKKELTFCSINLSHNNSEDRL